MWCAVVVLAGIVMAGGIQDGKDRVTVRRLSQHLQLTGWQTSWSVGGEIIPPLHTLPGGQIIALVESHQGAQRELVLWEMDGKELARNAVALTGDVIAMRVFGNRLLVATSNSVYEFNAGSLRGGRRREISFPLMKTTIYGLAPNGFWIVTEGSVSYFDLNGESPMVRIRPLVAAPEKPPCPAAVPCSGGFQPQHTEAVVSENGDLLVFDLFLEQYPYGKDPGHFDEVWPSTGTVLDTRGTIVTQKATSWMKPTREWFWSTSVSQSGPFPSDWGLVRRRYETTGLPLGRLFGSRGNDFLFLSSYDEGELRRVGKSLGMIWRQTVQSIDMGTVVSPLWSSPILLHDSFCYRFSTISESGRSKVEKSIRIEQIVEEQARTKYKRPRFAIGQSTKSDWLLIAY
jgi:hypothetical protein